MQPARVITFKGLGTYWECEILDDLSNKKTELIKECLVNRLNKFTSCYSRFYHNSLVGQLNQNGAIFNPPDEMLRMFEFARDAFYQSNGIFDISVGGILAGIGYGFEQNKGGINCDFWDLSTVSSQKIEIPKNTTIDFGGFGKGWLIDGFVDILNANHVEQFIINGGGDLYVQSNDAIEIKLEHPYDANKFIGQTKIAHGALAASSVVKRTWQSNGKNHHHIINPMSGESSKSDTVCSFVKADSALIADMVATVLIIKPSLELKLSKHYNLQTILLTKGHF